MYSLYSYRAFQTYQLNQPTPLCVDEDMGVSMAHSRSQYHTSIIVMSFSETIYSDVLTRLELLYPGMQLSSWP